MQLYKSQDIGHQMPGVPPIFQILTSIIFIFFLYPPIEKIGISPTHTNNQKSPWHGVHEAIPHGEGTRKSCGQP